MRTSSPARSRLRAALSRNFSPKLCRTARGTESPAGARVGRWDPSPRSTHLERVAQPVAERQHQRVELRVTDEELVELAQGLRRGGLLRRAYLAGHLPAPQEVVHDDDSPDAQQWQREFEVAAVLLLHGVYEDEVESLFEPREHFERGAALDADALSEARAAQVLLAARDHLVAQLDCDDEAVGGERAREVYDRVADSHPHFADATRPCRPGSDLKEARHFGVGDGDALLVRVTLHLCQEAHVRREEAFEIFGLLAAEDCVNACFHFSPSFLFGFTRTER